MAREEVWKTLAFCEGLCTIYTPSESGTFCVKLGDVIFPLVLATRSLERGALRDIKGVG